jgi:ribokinase
MAAAGRVVVVGSFNVDHAWRCTELPVPGATLAGEYASGPGGKGFNQAVAAARAGAATTFICALGDDAGAGFARALAQADGIDLRAASSNAPTGTAGIFVDAQGRNSIVIGAGANGTLSPGFVAAQEDAIDAADVVLAQMESPVEAILQALRRARALGIHAILNPAPANAEVPASLLQLADVLTPNETEFTALMLRHVGTAVDASAVATMEDAALHAHCRALLPGGTVVVTLGATGCFVSHPGGMHRGDARGHYRVPAEAVRAMDTTGAGDAFNGALAAALAGDPQRAFARHARFANCFAALSTETAGAAAAMPRHAELASRFPIANGNSSQ